jgi:tetratricopeptide (TPR) repeat protein
MKIKKIFFFLFIFFYVVAQAQIFENKTYNLFLQKQYDKVIEMVEEMQNLNAEDWYYAGLSAEKTEDIPLAAFYFQKSLFIDSTFIPAKISLAQALFQQEEFVSALEIYAQLLETDTLNAFLWSNLGDCYSKIALHPLAYSCYENAFYLNPKNSSNTLKLVSTLSVLKNKDYMEEAFFYCDSSLKYDPNNKPLLRKKASILFAHKEFLQATPILELLMSERDSSFQVLKQAGICKALFNKYDEAIFLLRKAHQQSKKDMEVMLHFASALSHKPELFDETVQVIAAIRKNVEPDSAIIYQTNTLFAQSYLGIKDTVNAVIQYYYSINQENNDDRLLRMANLANSITPETSHTLLWYVHYWFLQNFKPEYERHWNFQRQKSFSQFLIGEYFKYMHMSGKKSVKWQTFNGKWKIITMDDLRKIIK